MREIDLQSWDRREHFAFFSKLDLPVYNISFEQNISDFVAYVKEQKLSFYYSMIYVSMLAINQVENFRYRIRGEKVILHERIHPSFTDLAPGSTLFKYVTVDFIDGLHEFVANTKRLSESQRDYFPKEMKTDRDDFVYISSLPWVSFTALDHTASFNKADAIPRVSWGKFFTRDGQIILPYNIQVHHAFVDGLHLGLFKEELDKALLAFDPNKAIV